MKKIIFLLLISITASTQLQCNLQKKIKTIEKNLSVYYTANTHSLDLSELALTNKRINSTEWKTALKRFSQKHIIIKVDLKQNNLKKIPAIIYKFPDIEEIDLSENKIEYGNFNETTKSITHIAKLFDYQTMQAGAYPIYKLISSKKKTNSIMIISPHYQKKCKKIILGDKSITIIFKPTPQKGSCYSAKNAFLALLSFAAGILVYHAYSTLL